MCALLIALHAVLAYCVKVVLDDEVIQVLLRPCRQFSLSLLPLLLFYLEKDGDLLLDSLPFLVLLALVPGDHDRDPGSYDDAESHRANHN